MTETKPTVKNLVTIKNFIDTKTNSVFKVGNTLTRPVKRAEELIKIGVVKEVK